MKTKIVFFGTPQFAVPALTALTKNKRFDVVLVVTQPDRTTGRKKVITPPPVKVYAEKKKIPVLQPEKLDASAIDAIAHYKPDLAVVVAYGNLLPSKLLSAVPSGFVNIHPSLLPRYRGASPITQALIDGAAETGVSLMQLDDKMDHGPIIAQRPVSVAQDETSATLREKLVAVSVLMLEDELLKFIDGELKPTPQDDTKATHAPLIEAENAHINWKRDVTNIERLVRAMNGVEPAWSLLKKTDTRTESVEDQKLIIHRARIHKMDHALAPGTLTERNDTPAVAAKDGYLLIDELQLSGGKPMGGKAFLNGRKELLGEVLK